MADEKPEKPVDTTEYKSGRVSIPKIGATAPRSALEIIETLVRQCFFKKPNDVSR